MTRAAVGVEAIPGRRRLDRDGVVMSAALRRAPALGVAAAVVDRRAVTSAATSAATRATDGGYVRAGPGSLSVGVPVGRPLCVRPGMVVVVMVVTLVVAVGVAVGASAAALDGDGDVDEHVGEHVGEVGGGNDGDRGPGTRCDGPGPRGRIRVVGF